MPQEPAISTFSFLRIAGRLSERATAAMRM
jgi:hypothetical protein